MNQSSVLRYSGVWALRRIAVSEHLQAQVGRRIAGDQAVAASAAAEAPDVAGRCTKRP